MRRRAAPSGIPSGMRAVAVVLVVGLAVACVPGSPGAERRPTPAPTGPTVEIGVTREPESRLLGHVMRELLAASGIPGAVEQLDDRRAVRQALELGAVDVTTGYTGEAWLEVLGRPDPSGDPLASFRAVRDADAERGLIWMRPRFGEGTGPTVPPADATFALFVQSAPLAGAPGLMTMTELASRIVADPGAAVCVAEEFGTRQDGLSAVWRDYSVDPDRSYVPAAPRQAVRAVAAGDCLAGLASATSGEAWRANLRPLVDDRRVFPALVVTPVVREAVSARRPELLEALAPLPDTLTTRMLGQWNARVASGAGIEEVAAAAAGVLLAAADVPAEEGDGGGG